MDASDEAYLLELMGSSSVLDLKTIQSRLEQLLKDSIMSEIYSKYSPTTYVRTYMFLESVRAYVNDMGEIYVYSDVNTGYYSAVSGEDVSSSISGWLEGGHSDNTGINNQYHNYTPRLYLEKAYSLIKSEYPMLRVSIIDD